MAVAFVQGPVASEVNGATTVNITFASTPAAGNLIVAAGTIWGGNQTLSCSDNKGNTYAEAVTRLQGTQLRAEINYAANIASSATFTVTMTASASTNMALGINEYSGADTVPLNLTNNNGAASGTAITAGSVSPSGTDLIFGVATLTAETSLTAAATWTTRQDHDNSPDGANTQLSAIDKFATGAQNATWTGGSSTEWSAVVATFMAAGAGGRTTRNTLASPLGSHLGRGLWTHGGSG